MIRDPGYAQNPVARLITGGMPGGRGIDSGFSMGQPQGQINPALLAALQHILAGQQHGGVQPGGFLGGPMGKPAGGYGQQAPGQPHPMLGNPQPAGYGGDFAGTGNHMSHAWGGFARQPQSPWGIGGLVKAKPPTRQILPMRPQAPAYGQPFNPYGGSNGGGMQMR